VPGSGKDDPKRNNEPGETRPHDLDGEVGLAGKDRTGSLLSLTFRHAARFRLSSRSAVTTGSACPCPGEEGAPVWSGREATRKS
jgi:hypothetical protein